MNEIYNLINKISRKEHLTEIESSRLIQIALLGGASPTQISAIIMGMQVKGEDVDEIFGAYKTISNKFPKDSFNYEIFEVCGTGSFIQNKLNISTAVAFVLAGSGIKVAKHLDKTSVTLTGSTEVLKKLGVNLNASFKTSIEALEEAGICITTLPKYHSIMREIIPIIGDLNIKNIFNLVGAIANPIQCTNRLLGVYKPELILTMSEVLEKIGVKNAWVVHGADGTDEISISGETFVREIKEGLSKEFTIHPADAGLEIIANQSNLEGLDSAYNARRIYNLLKGENDDFRQIVLFNAAAGMVISDKTRDLKDGVHLASESIDSGQAFASLQKLVEVTNREMD